MNIVWNKHPITGLLLPFDLPATVSAAPCFPPAPWTYALEYDPAPSALTAALAVPNSFFPPAARSLGEILFNEKTLAIVWLGGVVAVLLAHS